MPRSSATTRASQSLPPTNVVAFPAAEPTAKGKTENPTITKPMLRKLGCPDGKEEAFHWDALTGFGLRCRASGKRTWVLQYRVNGQSRRTTIGSADVLSPEEARALAKKLLGKVSHGEDPSRQRQADRAAILFGDAVEAYLHHVRKTARPKTLKLTELCLEKHAKALHRTGLAKLARIDISHLHERITISAGPVVANRMVERLSAMLNWAIAKGYRETNPAARVPLNPEAKRTRILSDQELRALWNATTNLTGPWSGYNRAIRVLLLTGARRDEVGGMAWDEVDGQRWTIPAERMKSARPHEVWLSRLALAQMPPSTGGRMAFRRDGEGPRTGLTGWGGAKTRLDALLAAGGAPWEPWTLHDLRRTMATRLHSAGTAPHIVEACLAHLPSTQSGVAGVYNLSMYFDEKVAAWERWSAMVEAIVS